jgi:hypothetical protein
MVIFRTPFNKLFKFKTLEVGDPVFNNYDDIPSKLALHKSIKYNTTAKEPLNAHIESQHSETDLTINTFSPSPAPTQSFLAMTQKSHII